MGLNRFETSLKSWIDDEKVALEFVSLLGMLFLDRNVELILFRSQLIDRSASVVLNKHSYAINVIGYTLDIRNSLLLARAIAEVDITNARLDIGKLGKEWLEEKDRYTDARAFIEDKLKDGIGKRQTLKPLSIYLWFTGKIFLTNENC